MQLDVTGDGKGAGGKVFKLIFLFYINNQLFMFCGTKDL